MDWEMERIHRISVRKLMDARLGPSLRRKLLISNVLESAVFSRFLLLRGQNGK